ncbi:hypothetical protein ACK1QP_001273 [Salmonella enterica]|nr:hypothetical protein [Salmonella enterica subsp. enterica]
MKRLVFAVLTLTCFSASAKDKPLDGKESMTHDYNCMGVSTGRSAVMTVQEFPGGANQILIAENAQKPMAVTLSAIDDQTRASRQYEFKSSNGSAEILQVSDLTGIATTTMLHTVGLEAFTSLVCHEDK